MLVSCLMNGIQGQYQGLSAGPMMASGCRNGDSGGKSCEQEILTRLGVAQVGGPKSRESGAQRQTEARASCAIPVEACRSRGMLRRVGNWIKASPDENIATGA